MSPLIHQPAHISGHAFGVIQRYVTVYPGLRTRELRYAGAPPWAIMGPPRWGYDCHANGAVQR